jgi:hypothetical protein
MSIITEEEKREIIIEYVRHVFEEVQTEGWKKRRNEFLFQYRFHTMHDFQLVDGITFDEAMMEYKGDLDEVFTYYLYPIISNPDWIEAWFYKMRPELDEREGGEREEKYYWDGWDALYEFMYTNTAYDDMKEILGLDIELK